MYSFFFKSVENQRKSNTFDLSKEIYHAHIKKKFEQQQQMGISI